MAGPGARPTVRVEGATELRRAMRRMGEDLGELRDTHREGAELVRDEAEGTAPRRSGALSRSHRVQASRTRASVSAGSRLAYAAVIHFGWPAHRIAPQPWLYEAADDRNDAVRDVYERRVAELVRRLDREA